VTEPTNELPRLAPGTYQLTKRVVVKEDGLSEFVDEPVGEYIKGFWPRTRTRVTPVGGEETNLKPDAPQVSMEELREKVASVVDDYTAGEDYGSGPTRYYLTVDTPDELTAHVAAALFPGMDWLFKAVADWQALWNDKEEWEKAAKESWAREKTLTSERDEARARLRGMARRASKLRRSREAWRNRANKEVDERLHDTAASMANAGLLRAENRRVKAEWDEALSALKKQQALLAGLAGIPEDARSAIRDVISNPALRKLPREVFDGQRETIASWGARAVLDLLASWGARSATSEATPVQHKVFVRAAERDWWESTCSACGIVQYSPSKKRAEDWKDRHEADTLVPQIQANPKLEQNLDEGLRPSVSEAERQAVVLANAISKLTEARDRWQAMADEHRGMGWPKQANGVLLPSQFSDQLSETLLALMGLRPGVVPACSCSPVVVPIHQATGDCWDAQYQPIHELLEAALDKAHQAGVEELAYGSASHAGDVVLELLDLLSEDAASAARSEATREFVCDQTEHTEIPCARCEPAIAATEAGPDDSDVIHDDLAEFPLEQLRDWKHVTPNVINRGVSGEADTSPPDLRAVWQCSGCKRFYFALHQEQCPGCARVGYWTGSHEGNGFPGNRPPNTPVEKIPPTEVLPVSSPQEGDERG